MSGRRDFEHKRYDDAPYDQAQRPTAHNVEVDAGLRSSENLFRWCIRKPWQLIHGAFKRNQQVLSTPLQLLHIVWLCMRHPLRFARHLRALRFVLLWREFRRLGFRKMMASVRSTMIAPTAPGVVRKSIRPVLNRDAFMKAKKAALQDYLQKGDTLVFPVFADDPVLTVVIVLFNKAELTLACLRTLCQSSYRNYEVVIIDNNSSDQTHALLATLRNAIIVENNENVHFLRANNQALSKVRGRYLLFLNNDTELEKNAIERALRTIESSPGCGAVGAKLVHPGDRLQEAGSIVWSDGSCHGYGRGADPLSLEYNFMRELDFCSGAFLLTRTELFSRHGGFDTLYEPAYYEETDYCFWLQDNGYHVLYDPRVTVMHLEFGSGPSEAGIILQKRNQARFAKKHAIRLAGQMDPCQAQLHAARFSRQARNRPRILCIEDMVPHRDCGSGFPRSNMIINLMAEQQYSVSVYAMNFPVQEDLALLYRDLDPRIEVIDGYGPDCLAALLKERTGYYDIIWVSRPHNMEAFNRIRSACLDLDRVRVIYDAEAIFAQRTILQSRVLADGKINAESAVHVLQQELDIAKRAHTVVAVSDDDAEYFRKNGSSDVHVIGHVMEGKPTPASYAARKGLLFVGNLDYDDSPNVDSVMWFSENVWPLIKRDIPDITFDIVGSAESRLIRRIKGADISVHGRVDACLSFYNGARLFVAPTRFSAGIPIKVLEAAAFGLPVVATSLLASQLGWQSGKQLWAVEPEADRFSEMVIRAYQDHAEWEHIRQSATHTVEHAFSKVAFLDKLSQLLQPAS